MGLMLAHGRFVDDRDDVPFALPAALITTTVDLPFPPSANTIWRRGKGRTYRSAKYKNWQQVASNMLLAQGRIRRIDGKFTAYIKLNEDAGRGDADNRVKVVLDLAQRCGLVADDKHCRRVTIEWVEAANAPEGCRLRLEEMAR